MGAGHPRTLNFIARRIKAPSQTTIRITVRIPTSGHFASPGSERFDQHSQGCPPRALSGEQTRCRLLRPDW